MAPRNKTTGKGAGGMDLRGMSVALLAGGSCIAVAAQLMAKPNQTVVAGAVDRAAGTTRDSRTGGITLTGTPTPLRLVAEPPVRELFVPLVSRPKPVQNQPKPQADAKPLPSVKSPAPVPKVEPAADGSGNPGTQIASETTVRDIQMLGVVEMDGQPQVLLRKTPTNERHYFAKGQDAYGFTVDDIKESEVTLSRSGKSERVAMSSAVAIESTTGSTSVAPSGYNGAGFNRGSFSGRNGGGRNGFNRGSGDGGGYGRNRDGGNGGGGGSSTGFSTAGIFSVSTWKERLKKLEEARSQMPADQYERLHKFIAEKAKEEK